ncbi:F-box only protein 40-like [Astyanax mexicanus]|uniref:F-box only protein 40-like n=1 Tax=Astyanax mexicanus TaxID=7994 RepID=A0A8B9KBU1_ASTMX|nr:F-box only protein 40-like [Astyanax mexicanus]
MHFAFPFQSRYKRSTPKLHRHCETCYSKRCRAPIEISVCCLTINCRALCGATFHMCKEDEHILLCPNEQVPCLNAHYGCPFTMCRSKLAKHLETCPASVVCCSMEWIRWPIEDVKSPLYTNLLKDVQEPQALDLSMALRDQKHLCARLKMRSFFPELMEEPEEPVATKEEEEEDIEGDEATGGDASIKVDPNILNGIKCSAEENSMNGPLKKAETAEMQLDKTHQNHTVDREKYNIYETMFSMEKGGCKQAENEGSVGKTVDKTKQDKKESPSNGSTHQSVPEQQDTSSSSKDTAERRDTSPQPDFTKTGLAPWQDGVLERLGKEVNPREYNMYIVHHGRMLLTFGHIEACTPREKDFVYGSLEPIPVQTLRSFNVPVSYRHRRIQLKDPVTRAKTEHKTVDTSDLGVPMEDIQKMDEMFATLLVSAEVEIRGHKISETVATDGLYVDIATQTYDFVTAPFKYDATLADITADVDLKLHLQTDTESVTLRHNKSTSAFSFSCGHFFRRDEYASHFKNVHSDIQSCLSGWFEQRCPLAYLGCTFVHKRLQPSTQRAVVSYNQDLSIFTLRPEIDTSLKDHSQMDSVIQQIQAKNEDSLSDLPFEVLRHIASYLDSFSLSQLALVSRLFRDVSATLLQERGMVGLKWKMKIYSHGRVRWKSSVVWEFSNLFSNVSSWCIDGSSPMAEHLKRCPFYQMEPKTKPFALPSMQNDKGKEQQRNSEERQSLVMLFTGRR